jgi:hypothetical protein
MVAKSEQAAAILAAKGAFLRLRSKTTTPENPSEKAKVETHHSKAEAAPTSGWDSIFSARAPSAPTKPEPKGLHFPDVTSSAKVKIDTTSKVPGNKPAAESGSSSSTSNNINSTSRNAEAAARFPKVVDTTTASSSKAATRVEGTATGSWTPFPTAAPSNNEGGRWNPFAMGGEQQAKAAIGAEAKVEAKAEGGAAASGSSSGGIRSSGASRWNPFSIAAAAQHASTNPFTDEPGEKKVPVLDEPSNKPFSNKPAKNPFSDEASNNPFSDEPVNPFPSTTQVQSRVTAAGENATSTWNPFSTGGTQPPAARPHESNKQEANWNPFDG